MPLDLTHQSKMALNILTILVAVLAFVQYVPMISAQSSAYGQNLLQVTSASSAFSQLLHKEVASNQPNAIFSPFSVHACLSMAYLGARGTTASAMKSTLQLSGINSPHGAYHDLIDDLNSAINVKLLTANGMFINPKYPINEDYQEDVMDNYLAISQNIDMNARKGPEAPINAWVAGKTENKISSILPQNTIKPETMMILINSIFFNGTWAKPFKAYATTRKPFTREDGSTSNVDLMHMSETFLLKEEAIPNVDVVRIPFKNHRFAMYIALPRTSNGISALESYITGNNPDIDVFFKDMKSTKVDLHLPKFKLTSTMTLNNALGNMGMTNAFSDNANFSGVSPVPMKISKVLQKALIEVKETGTVAAAVTAVIGFQITSAFHPYVPPFVFKADHPFLFYLRDSNTGQILFQGKFADPDKSDITVP